MKSAIAKLSCLVVVIGLSLSLYASTPSSASLSPTAGATVSWTGTDKGGASTDESTCVDGVNCDAFTLNLSGTPSNWAGKFVVVKITWSLSTNDYDLYVHKGTVSGPAVASSTNGAPEVSEQVTLSPSSLGTGAFVMHSVDFTVA